MLTCPNCDVELQLGLALAGEGKMDSLIFSIPSSKSTWITIGGKDFEVSRFDVLEQAKNLMPNRIRTYSVKLEAKDGRPRDFPIKQVIRAVLRKDDPEWDESGFTAHRARDLLKRLGFDVIVH